MNWQKMLFELLRNRTMKQLSKETSIKLWTIRRIKEGNLIDPRYSDGVKLESFYYKTISKV